MFKIILLWVLHIILLYLCLTVPYIAVHLRLDNYGELYSTKMMLDISITYFNRNNFQTLFVFFLRSRWIIRSDRRTYMAPATAPSACLHTFSAYTCLKVCLHTKAVFSATLSCLFIYILYMCKQVCIWRCVCLRIPNFIPIKRSMRSRGKAKASAHLRIPLNAEYTIYLCASSEMHKQLANEKVVSCQGSWPKGTQRSARCNAQSTFRLCDEIIVHWNSLDKAPSKFQWSI